MLHRLTHGNCHFLLAPAISILRHPSRNSLAILVSTLLSFQVALTPGYSQAKTPIDRKALVSRHSPRLDQPDNLSSFTVGNGEFAFTVDVTGLQTFPSFYEETGVPLGTQSHWGWHTIQDAPNYTLDQASKLYDTYGRQVKYASIRTNDAAKWLRSNPHRLHLGQVGFQLTGKDGQAIQLTDVTEIDQKLDLWEGIVSSNYRIENTPVRVETACHPELDQVAVSIRSELISQERLSIVFEFPYGSLSWGKTSADWQSPDRHSSEILDQRANSVVIKRRLDAAEYYVEIRWQGNAGFEKIANHSFVLAPSGEDFFSFTFMFAPTANSRSLPYAPETFEASRSHWQRFWEKGGAIDLSGSSNPRAHELERRIVLSQYLTAIQCAGSLPPAETGLTCNSWHGKFHLEMHWWHGVHFALWGRPELFEKSLSWYRSILPSAMARAEAQGYRGVRWPKMVGPDGRESPSDIGVFLIWQQPHPIYYAELLYRIEQDEVTLQEYKDLVFASADFLASYAVWDEANRRYVLGPPLIPAQEIYPAETTMNPAFELSYWAYGLRTAQRWRERLGLPRHERWDHVLDHMSVLPQNDGLYQNAEIAMDTFADPFHRNDHPTLLGAFGMLPNENIDVETMRRTLKKVMESWNWQRTWGWDYPMVAMTAARVGEPDLAIDALFMDVQKNRFSNNGHNYQDDNLTLYLPGNGGLLTAVAMMAAGWDGMPQKDSPGFPANGNWVVKWEGLATFP